MSLRQLIGCSAAALVGAGAMLASIASTQATMLPVSRYATPYVQHVDCAIGAHIGPLGGCILGTDEPRHDGVEHRDGNGGCETKSVSKQDAAGNSETKTKTNC